MRVNSIPLAVNSFEKCFNNPNLIAHILSKIIGEQNSGEAVFFSEKGCILVIIVMR